MTDQVHYEEHSTIIPLEISEEKGREKDGKRCFGMFIILQKTFLELFSFKRVLPYILLSFTFSFVLATVITGNMGGQISNMSIDFQIATVVNYFAFAAFFWDAGILLWVFCGLTSSNFISTEETGGTMIFLLTKPIRRSTLYISKFLGYFFNMAILQFFSLLISLTTISGLFGVSTTVFVVGLKFLVPIYLYALLLIVCVGLIMGFLSIVNKRIVVNVLLLMLIVVVIYFLGIIFRVAIPSYYERYNRYLS